MLLTVISQSPFSTHMLHNIDSIFGSLCSSCGKLILGGVGVVIALLLNSVLQKPGS